MSGSSANSLRVQPVGAQAEWGRNLFAETVRSLGWRYYTFVTLFLFLGLSVLLPSQLVRFFTAHAQRITELNAASFLKALVLFGISVALVTLFATLASTLLHEWLRLQTEASLRRKVLRRIQAIPLRILDGAQRGDWLTRMTGDLSQVERFLTESIPGQLRNLAILVGTSTLFVAYSGIIALVPLATAAGLAFISFKVQKALSPVLSEMRSLHGELFQILIESLEGLRTIRSQIAENYVAHRFETKLQHILSRGMRIVSRLATLLGGTQFFSQLMITACLTAAAWALVHRELTLDQILVYPFFLALFYSAAQGIANATYDWNRFFIEGGRLGALLYGESSAPVIAPGAGAPPDLGEAAEIEFKNIVLSQGHTSQVLAGPFSFSVRRGELIVLMGSSGCGKSTFLEVAAGLRSPLSGTTILLRSDGMPIWSQSHGPQIPVAACAYVEQHPYIFEGTLKENLIFGNASLTDELLIGRRLEQAGLGAFAKSRGGVESGLQDRGRNLSEGERYRIALCRALLLTRPFLLLDEPFAALDAASVQIVISTLNSEKAHRGIIVVTHSIPENLSIDLLLTLEPRGLFPDLAKANERVGPCNLPRRKWEEFPLSSRVNGGSSNQQQKRSTQ